SSELQESSAFSADGMALGGRALGTILLGAAGAEPDRIAHGPNKSVTSSGHSFTWFSNRDGVDIFGSGSGYDEATPLYICRLVYGDRWYVGYTSGADCHVGFEGRGLAFGIYEVLANVDPALWLVDGHGASKRPKLFAGKQDGKDVAICRAKYANGLY